jgi:Tol biopolymer transport system component/DNA-binding winged helix-turn-helix (wHTH) protein
VPSRFRWDDFVLDLDAYRLERAGVPVALEPKAFNLLVLMVQRPGHLFTKQEIFDRVWPGTAVTDHALTRIVAQIRRALGDEAREARYLETVPTRGYRWIHAVEAIDLPTPAVEPNHRSKPAVVPLLSVGVALAVILVMLVWARRGYDSGSEGAHGVQWPVQLTTNAGLDLQPALSPHEGAIAFVSDRTGSFEIYVRALGGPAIETPLTADGGQNVQPSWSPDGMFIAYHSQRNGGIWIVPSRGGTPRQVVTEGSKPSWSPDGASIAYQSDEHADVAPFGYAAQNGSTIRVTSVEGGGARELTHSGAPPGGHAAPSWSPDGRYVLFAVFDAGSSNGLWVLDRRTGSTRVLHRGDAVYESAFSPDAQAIYVASGDALIARLPFDAATGTVSGSPEIIPVPGVPGVRGISVSRDGSRLAFAGLGLSSQIWAQPVSIDGTPSGPSRALTSDTSRRNSLPAISPDGTKVVYKSSRRGERPNLWMMDVDGQHPLQLTSGSAFESQPVWSTDGSRIAYHSIGSDEEGLLSIDVATRKTDTLLSLASMRSRGGAATKTASEIAEVRLSPSTTQLAFSVRELPLGRRVLYTAPVENVLPRRVSDVSMSVGYPAWSPDEQRLAVEIKDGSSTQAAVLDVETGTLRQLTDARGQTWVRSWSPDGLKVAAAVMRGGQWSLRALDANGGREREITLPGPPRVFVRYPDWSARGDLIVFERAEMTGNIWLLDRSR